MFWAHIGLNFKYNNKTHLLTTNLFPLSEKQILLHACGFRQTGLLGRNFFRDDLLKAVGKKKTTHFKGELFQLYNNPNFPQNATN